MRKGVYAQSEVNSRAFLSWLWRKTWRTAFCSFCHLGNGLVRRNVVFVLSRCTLPVYLREMPVIRQQWCCVVGLCDEHSVLCKLGQYFLHKILECLRTDLKLTPGILSTLSKRYHKNSQVAWLEAYLCTVISLVSEKEVLFLMNSLVWLELFFEWTPLKLEPPCPFLDCGVLFFPKCEFPSMYTEVTPIPLWFHVVDEAATPSLILQLPTLDSWHHRGYRGFWGLSSRGLHFPASSYLCCLTQHIDWPSNG